MEETIRDLGEKQMNYLCPQMTKAQTCRMFVPCSVQLSFRRCIFVLLCFFVFVSQEAETIT